MKSRSLFVLITIALLSSLTSCGTMKTVSCASDYNEAFVGQSHNDIVTLLGPPTRQVTDGNGGLILCYEESIQHSTMVAENVNPYRGTYTPGVLTENLTSYVHFYINGKGSCYYVKTNHTKDVWVEANRGEKKAIWWVIGCTSAVCLLALLGAD